MAKRKIIPDSHVDRVVDVMDEALDIAFTYRSQVEGESLDKLINLISELGVLATSNQSVQMQPLEVSVSGPPPPPSSYPRMLPMSRTQR